MEGRCTDKAQDKRVRTMYGSGIGVTMPGNVTACRNGVH